jgi:hypothetical protein
MAPSLREPAVWFLSCTVSACSAVMITPRQRVFLISAKWTVRYELPAGRWRTHRTPEGLKSSERPMNRRIYSSCGCAFTSASTQIALSQLAQQASSGRLVWRDLVVNHARLHADLQVWIYRNQALTDLARPSLITIFVVLIAGLLVAIPKDVQWSRSRRRGRRLKGPELVSGRQFNRRTRADGIAFAHRSCRMSTARRSGHQATESARGRSADHCRPKQRRSSGPGIEESRSSKASALHRASQSADGEDRTRRVGATPPR